MRINSFWIILYIILIYTGMLLGTFILGVLI